MITKYLCGGTARQRSIAQSLQSYCGDPHQSLRRLHRCFPISRSRFEAVVERNKLSRLLTNGESAAAVKQWMILVRCCEIQRKKRAYTCFVK
jgi:hypothetical protein